jgi:multidrug transporter EmrE-like cation transporter
MAWLFLVVAGLCEIAWAIGLKYTEGFTRLLPTIGTVLAMAASIGFLGLALKSLPVGTAYAVWTGFQLLGLLLSAGGDLGSLCALSSLRSQVGEPFAVQKDDLALAATQKFQNT